MWWNLEQVLLYKFEAKVKNQRIVKKKSTLVKKSPNMLKMLFSLDCDLNYSMLDLLCTAIAYFNTTVMYRQNKYFYSMGLVKQHDHSISIS